MTRRKLALSRQISNFSGALRFECGFLDFLNPEDALPDREQAKKKFLLSMLRDFLLIHTESAGIFETIIEGLSFVRKDDVCHSSKCFSRPMATLIIQGEKRITLGSRELDIHIGQCLVTCVDTPSASIILNATPQTPFLCVSFLLDRKILTDLLLEMPPETRPQRPEYMRMPVMDASAGLIAAFLRFSELTVRPEAVPILAPLLQRELHYLLLAGPQGGILRDLYMNGARDNRILDAISWLKQHTQISISVEQLAKKVHMSVSSLHRHFKNITGLSPLQYHKQLRLYEAQRLMLVENERADMAALAVGYESITQFNREYKRMFGEPPHRDIMRRKTNLEGCNTTPQKVVEDSPPY